MQCSIEGSEQYLKINYFRVIKMSTIHTLDINYDVICNSAQLFRIHTLQYFSIKILIKKSKLQFTFLDDHLKLNGHQMYKLLKQIKIVKIKIHTVPVWVAVMHCISKNTLQFLYADLLPSPYKDNLSRWCHADFLIFFN